MTYDGDGFFNFNFAGADLTNATTDVNGFIGETAYVIIMNASTIASSTEFAIFGGVSSFAQDSASTQATPTQLLLSSNVLNGTSVGGLNLTHTEVIVPGVLEIDTAYTNGVQLSALSAVPEPSTLTLAGLGALTLVTRRRRA